MVKPLNELDTYKSHISKLSYATVLIAGSVWAMLFGLNMFAEKFFQIESLDNLKREIKVEEQLIKRQNIMLNTSEKKYKEITACITIPEVKK